MKAVITQPEILEAVVERMNQQLQDRKAPMARELERLMQDIQEKEANVQKFLNLMIEAPEIASDLTKRIRQLEQEKQMLLQKKQQLQRTLSKGAEQVSTQEARRALAYLDKSLDGKQNKELKEIYKVCIDKITFDKQSKEVAVHLLFGQDFIRKLHHATEKESSPTEGDGSFILSGEIYLVL